MNDGRSDRVHLCALGALSGVVVWALIWLAALLAGELLWSLFDGVIELSPISVLPGLVFGLIVGTLLHRRGKVTRSMHVWYAIAAGFAYFCAFHVATHTYLSLSPTLADMILSGILGGLVGSLLLGLIATRLLEVPARLLLRLPLLVGSAAGALLGLIDQDHSQWGWTFLVFFVLWQAAYATSLAPLLRALADGRR